MTVPETHHRDWEADAASTPLCPRCLYNGLEHNAMRWDDDKFECCSCWLSLALNPAEIEALEPEDLIKAGHMTAEEAQDD